MSGGQCVRGNGTRKWYRWELMDSFRSLELEWASYILVPCVSALAENYKHDLCLSFSACTISSDAHSLSIPFHILLFLFLSVDLNQAG